MTEPVSAAGGVLGVKYLTMIAGFFGGVLSLSYLEGMSKWQASLAVVAGFSCASFFAPPMAEYFVLGPKVEAGIGFLFGITGMNIVPGVIRIAEAFKRDPLWFVRALITKGASASDKPE